MSFWQTYKGCHAWRYDGHLDDEVRHFSSNFFLWYILLPLSVFLLLSLLVYTDGVMKERNEMIEDQRSIRWWRERKGGCERRSTEVIMKEYPFIIFSDQRKERKRGSLGSMTRERTWNEETGLFTSGLPMCVLFFLKSHEKASYLQE